MKKYNFSDIPQFTKSANYHINVSWSYLEKQLEIYQNDWKLDLDPDFQRAHVWSEEKQIKYIEFILRGGESSKNLYFNCVGWNKINNENNYFVLVDGKQRLEAVRKFMRNELKIFHNKELKNKKPLTFLDFGDKLRIVKAYFIININDLGTKKEVLQWYLDLNEGGVVHTSEELNKVKELLKLEK